MAGFFRVVNPSLEEFFDSPFAGPLSLGKLSVVGSRTFWPVSPGSSSPFVREFFDPSSFRAASGGKTFRPREPIILAGFSRTSTPRREVFRSRLRCVPARFRGPRRVEGARILHIPTRIGKGADARPSKYAFFARKTARPGRRGAGRCAAFRENFSPRPVLCGRNCVCRRPARPRTPVAGSGPHLRPPRHRSSLRALSACDWPRNCSA